MKASQVIGLVSAIILLFPGLCFLGFGSSFVLDSLSQNVSGSNDFLFGGLFAGIGVAIFVVIWMLCRHAFRKRPPS